MNQNYTEGLAKMASEPYLTKTGELIVPSSKKHVYYSLIPVL